MYAQSNVNPAAKISTTAMPTGTTGQSSCIYFALRMSISTMTLPDTPAFFARVRSFLRASGESVKLVFFLAMREAYPNGGMFVKGAMWT